MIVVFIMIILKVSPGDQMRLRGTSGAVQNFTILSWTETVPGLTGYRTVQLQVDSLTAQIKGTAKVEVTLIRPPGEGPEGPQGPPGPQGIKGDPGSYRNCRSRYTCRRYYRTDPYKNKCCRLCKRMATCIRSRFSRSCLQW